MRSIIIGLFAFSWFLLSCPNLSAEEKTIPAGLAGQIKSIEDVFNKIGNGDYSTAIIALSQMTALTKQEQETLSTNLSAKHEESEKLFGGFRRFKLVDVNVRYEAVARVRFLEVYERNGYVWNVVFLNNGDEWHLTSFDWGQPSKIWSQGEE